MSKTYYEKNSDKIKEYYRKYYDENSVDILARNRIYNAKNKENIKVKADKYYQDNKIHFQEQRKINCTVIKEKKKIYYNNNREQILEKIPRCKSVWCNITINKKMNEGFCLRCFIHTYPDKPVAKNYRTKEKTVVDYILQKYPNFTWNCDKKITDGCSRRRPDLLVDFGDFIIIVEIDENQHNDYDTT